MRQFVCSASPDKNGLLVLEKKDFHYLKTVLRLGVGDMVNVSIAGGQKINMTLCKIDEAGKKIVLQKCAESQNAALEKNASCKLCAEYYLFQFLPKPQKLELIVRQATECGVTCIVPIIGEYTQGGMEKALQNTARFERIIREARQQSGSGIETKILPCKTLSAALDIWREKSGHLASDEKAAVVLYERNENTIPLQEALCGDKIKMCALAVGSEGGISPSELKMLLDAGFAAVHFNTNILRCETAALYGMAAIQCAVEK